MFILSAFADEISPVPIEQVTVLKAANVRHIEFRSIHKTNCLKLTDEQIREFKELISGEGVKISAIGSPIGKYPVDSPFEPHLDLFKRACELAHIFNTPNIRVFSFYPPESGWTNDWAPHRGEVMSRMTRLAEHAAKEKLVLFHENEHKIYGDSPERVLDVLKTVNLPSLRAAYDAANYVHDGFSPVEGWDLTKEYTSHLHIKDWTHGEAQGRLAGHGQGKIVYSTYDCIGRDYHGFAVLEPHLRGGGPTGGVTGPDLFPVAVEAFRMILQVCGGKEQF